jgi:hypothetical protein
MRCPRHDLALASDGTCLRCRREEEEADASDPAAATRSMSAKGIALVAVGLCAAVGVATLVISGLRPAPSASPSRAAEAHSAAVAPGAASPAPLAALDPAIVSPDPRSSPAGASAPTPLDQAMHAAEITFYSRDGSPECGLARSWLLAGGYTFRERNVDADPSAREGWMQASAGGTVPAFDVDGQGFAGFDPARLQGALEYAGARRLQRR